VALTLGVYGRWTRDQGYQAGDGKPVRPELAAADGVHDPSELPPTGHRADARALGGCKLVSS